MGWLGEFQLWGGLYSENYVGSFFQLSVFYFCFFSSLHRSSLRILEYLREVWSWFWIVFHSLLIWRHGVRIISPKQWSKKNPKPSAQGLPYKHLSLIYLFAVHCTALLLPAKASPFPGLNSGRWGHPPTSWWLSPCHYKSLSCTSAKPLLVVLPFWRSSFWFHHLRSSNKGWQKRAENLSCGSWAWVTMVTNVMGKCLFQK